MSASAPGLLLRRDAGEWTSGLSSQVEPQPLLALVPAAPAGPGAGEGADWGLIVLVGLRATTSSRRTAWPLPAGPSGWVTARLHPGRFSRSLP